MVRLMEVPLLSKTTVVSPKVTVPCFWGSVPKIASVTWLANAESKRPSSCETNSDALSVADEVPEPLPDEVLELIGASDAVAVFWAAAILRRWLELPGLPPKVGFMGV